MRIFFWTLALLPFSLAAACGSIQEGTRSDAGAKPVDAGASTDASGHTCVVEGVTFALGQPIVTAHDCGLCTCAEFGLRCRQGVCPGTCDYEGKTYRAGENFLTPNGCNGCSCNVGRRGVSCTALAVCQYEGREYCRGASFKAPDGCNDCTCNGDEVTCTERACNDGGTDAAPDGM